jgi:thymidylate synthase (FAD)
VANVLMIASTELRNLDLIDDILALDSTGEYSDAEVLIEFAGRGCYQSWSRPNPETADTRDYVTKNILGKGHESVLEHASVTFYVTGVSRSLTHELIRHRHLSISELSQRYVGVQSARFVAPPLVRDALLSNEPQADAEERDAWWQGQDAWDAVREGYGDLTAELDELFPDKPRKEKREAARAVMPNATETKLSVTGNLRAWRHVIKLRGSLHADAEIREFAIEVFRQLEAEYPSVFADMEVRTDGPSGRQYIGEKSLEPAQLDGMTPVRDWPVKALGIVGETND